MAGQDRTDPDITQRPGGAAPGGTPQAGASTRTLRPEHPPRARHGYSSEVRWQTGQGHQPYANQGQEEAREPNLGDEFEGGDRGERSGNTLAQMQQVKQKP